MCSWGKFGGWLVKWWPQLDLSPAVESHDRANSWDFFKRILWGRIVRNEWNASLLDQCQGIRCGLVAPLSLFRIVLSHFPSDLEMLTASCSQLHFSASSHAMPRRLAPRPVYFLLPGTVAKAGLKNREVIEICRTQDFCLKFYTAEQCPTRKAAVCQSKSGRFCKTIS